MLTEYEAAILAKQKATGGVPALGQLTPARNRIGAVLLALSVLSAVGLLYSAFFHRGPVSSATRGVPDAATPVIHPVASGVPEGALFLRHRPLAGDARTTAEMAASDR
jgi:hypothetical protein